MNFNIFQQIDLIRELPTLPVIVMRVNQILQNKDTTADQLTRVIETDQAMAAKILKLVNSSFYGFQSKITSINAAVIILGFNTIQHVVVSLSVINSFERLKNPNLLNIKVFWRHALSVAIISKYLADQFDKNLSSICFTAGLLHDIGKIILAEYFPVHFEKIWLTARNSAISFLDAENMLYPFNHATVGAYLVEKWRLPPSLTAAIGFHHSPFTEDHRTATIIGVSDLITHIHNPYPEGHIQPPADISGVPEFLQPAIHAMAEWYPNIETEITNACQIFMEPLETGL